MIIAKWFIRQPAIHFAAFGILLFFAISGGDNAEQPTGTRPRLELPSSRLAEAELRFRKQQRRPPSDADRVDLVRELVDEEVLFRHALELGLHHAEIPRRRLAQIAAFVEPASSEIPAAGDPAAGDPAAGDPAAGDLEACEVVASTPQTALLARRAVELGLHEGDFVTRRVLVDAARRLIRGAARLIEPGEQAVEDYLQANADDFRGADRYRVSHIFLRDSRHENPAQAASTLLDRLRHDTTWPENAVSPETTVWPKNIAAMTDPGLVPPHLPLLDRRAFERRFGVGFTRRLAELPAGEWAGPVRSRYGTHLVFVHERRPGRVPEPSEVAGAIRARLREQAADRWLAERLRQLRADYEIVAPLEGQVAS